jgi:hypothetical protein
MSTDLTIGQQVKLKTLKELFKSAKEDDVLCESLEDDPGISDTMRKYFGTIVTVEKFRNGDSFYIEEDDDDDWIWSKLWIKDDYGVSKYLLEKELFTI